MAETTILESKNLDLFYGDHQALKGISMAIPEKQITALIGPSGCGKSTFMKTINRMNDLIPGVTIKGELLYRGQDIYSSEVNVTWLRKRIGMVFQKPNPFPMSIFDNVPTAPAPTASAARAKLDDIVERSLRQAAIWDEVKGPAEEVRPGPVRRPAQRLCIARALAVEPDVLLMDEATSALDPISTSKIEDLAVELKKSILLLWSRITCSRPPASPTRRPSSCWESWWSSTIPRSSSHARRQAHRGLHHGEVR